MVVLPHLDGPRVEKRERARWAQFRLRSLLLLTFVCSVALAVLLPYVESYRHEWRIYRALNRLPYAVGVSMEPKAPAWLRLFGAERYMQRIVAVRFDDDAEDDSLALLAALPALESLDVKSTTVTDSGLKHLEGCSHLFRLVLDCPNISDRGLESLEKFSELGMLTLKTPLITDAGLKNLSDLKELRSLQIVAPKVGDDGMRHIGRLALWDLKMTASVGDRGFQYLVNQRNLPWSPDQQPEPQSIICVRPGQERLAEVLRERGEADFKNLPLCDVLKYIGFRHEISLSTADDLKRAGIDPMTPITCKTPPSNPLPGGYRLYDLLNELLPPAGLDWRIGSKTDTVMKHFYIEVLPRKTLSPQRPNLLKLRAAWPKCPVIVPW